MSPQRRQKLLLALLAVGLLLVAWRFLPGWLAGDEAGSTFRAGGRDAGPAAAEGIEVATLNLEALTGRVRDYDPGRNPFDYQQPPPPPPPPGPSPEELRRREEERRRLQAERERQEQEREVEPPPPPRPKPPPFQLTYLGSFGPEERRIAVFTDGEQIYNALIGDVLEDKFIVSDIGYESVSITYVGFPDEPATRVAIGG